MIPLAIGSIFRDESRYMREWLEFHLDRGVEHFFLLQNDDLDTQEFWCAQHVLEPYINRGLVTVAHHADRTPKWQATGWGRIMATWAPGCDWIALIDLDVFMVPMKCDSVCAVLANYDRDYIAGLVANYCTFGDSHLADPPKLQTESLVWRARLDAPCNRTYNPIVRPARMQPGDDPEGYHVVRPGMTIIDTSYTVIPAGCGKRDGPMDILRLHHYGVRSRADWQRKVDRGWPDAIARWTDPNHRHEDHKHAMINRNDERDHEMERFLPVLKKRLGTT